MMYNTQMMDRLASVGLKLFMKAVSFSNGAWDLTALGLSPKEVTDLHLGGNIIKYTKMVSLNHPQCG